MSKHSCYIENSQEAREWLTSIGIRLNSYLRFELAKYIYFYNDTGIACFINDRDLSMINTVTTDCTGNLPLFKALTAVRDDSDYMQWFVADQIISFKESYKKLVLEGDFFLCNVRNINSLKPEYYKLIQGMRFWHKANKEELIEKFK